MFMLHGISRRTQRAAAAIAALLALAVIIALPADAAHTSRSDEPSSSSASPVSATRSEIREPARNDAPTIRHARIRLATGVELHVAEAGPADGVPVLLLHGFTDSWFSWSPVLERLPAGVRAIVPTHRGHGDSERPACCYRIADLALDAVALLDALGIERSHVIGHSMGGFVAQRIAIDSPDRVDHLVIVSSAATARNDGVLEFNEVVQQLEDPVDEAFIREFQAGTAAAPLAPAFLDRIVEESGKLPARIWRDALGSMIDPAQAQDPSRIRARTLIVYGAHDGIFPRATQDTLAALIPDARLLVYPDAGHSPNWEFPDRLVADLAAFLGLSGPGR